MELKDDNLNFETIKWNSQLINQNFKRINFKECPFELSQPLGIQTWTRHANAMTDKKPQGLYKSVNIFTQIKILSKNWNSS